MEILICLSHFNFDLFGYDTVWLRKIRKYFRHLLSRLHCKQFQEHCTYTKIFVKKKNSFQTPSQCCRGETISYSSGTTEPQIRIWIHKSAETDPETNPAKRFAKLQVSGIRYSCEPEDSIPLNWMCITVQVNCEKPKKVVTNNSSQTQTTWRDIDPEPEFLNFSGAQESIPNNQLRKPM
jgi:hypothetical protein